MIEKVKYFSTRITAYIKEMYLFVFKISKINYKIYDAVINLDISKDVDRRLFLYGFEKDTMKQYYNSIKKNDVVMDIGANIGIYSLIASNKIGENGKIFSFEPADIAFKGLVHNVKLNKFTNISTIKSGVSDYTGEAILNVCEDDAYNSLGGAPMRDVVKRDRIQVVSIDDFVQSKSITKVNVMKIDTEGAEYLVLKGAEKTLKLHRPILFFEYNPLVTKGFSNSSGDLIDYVKTFNYNLFEIHKGKLLKIEDAKDIKSNDIIGMPS